VTNGPNGPADFPDRDASKNREVNDVENCLDDGQS
jgi:hypothetical protein